MSLESLGIPSPYFDMKLLRHKTAVHRVHLHCNYYISPGNGLETIVVRLCDRANLSVVFFSFYLNSYVIVCNKHYTVTVIDVRS